MLVFLFTPWQQVILNDPIPNDPKLNDIERKRSFYRHMDIWKSYVQQDLKAFYAWFDMVNKSDMNIRKGWKEGMSIFASKGTHVHQQ